MCEYQRTVGRQQQHILAVAVCLTPQKLAVVVCVCPNATVKRVQAAETITVSIIVIEGKIPTEKKYEVNDSFLSA